MCGKLFYFVLLLAITNAGYAGEANNSETTTLETVRKLVARNEALINPIKVSYTVKVIRINDRPITATGGRRPSGRGFSHHNVVWAQSGQNQYVKYESFYGPNEPADSSVKVFDEQIVTEAKLPDMMEGYIQAKIRHNTCWYHVLTTKLGLRPFGGKYNLSEVLVPELATIHNELESIGSRRAYVINVQRPDFSSYFSRVWIDSERGIPLLLRSYNQYPDRDPNGFSSELKSTDFYQLPNGGWIPIEGTRSLYFRRSDPLRVTYENLIADVNSITTKLDDIPESLFIIEFPNGARIHSDISGLTSVVGQPLKTYEQIVNASSKYIAGMVVNEENLSVPGVVVGPFVVRTKQSNGRFRSRPFQLHDRQCAITDKKGRFAIELEQEGLYELCFFADDFVDMRVRDIPLGEHNLKITLRKGGTVTGRVVRLKAGRKIPVANVDIRTEEASRIKRATLRRHRTRTKTDSEGRFQIKYLEMFMPTRETRDLAQPHYIPRTWQIRCGSMSETVMFEEGKNTLEVELVLKPDLQGAVPLIGRALPDFEGINIDLPADRVIDKRMLVCFFDMEQRPSRNCIRQLSERAEELKAKDVVIIAIQASKVDGNILNDWIKENDISFPVGKIEGDTEQTRINWGVESLPWLILTGKNHIVKFSGFSVTELDNQIQLAHK